MMKKELFCIVLIAFMGMCVKAQPAIRYVKEDGLLQGAEASAALSWEKACFDLQAVINISKPGDQIWVAKGTYRPVRRGPAGSKIDSGHSDNAFVLKGKVALYGGFEGTEPYNYHVHKRNCKQNQSILKGVWTQADGTLDSVYHVVIVASKTSHDSYCLDGFTIEGGNANGNDYCKVNDVQSIPRNHGGGMLIQLNGESSTLSLRNNIFLNNSSGTTGGGLFVYSNGAYSTVDIINNVFINNSVKAEGNASGGGVFAVANAANALINIQDNTFTMNQINAGNTATGGGIHAVVSDAYANMMITGNVISNNIISVVNKGAVASGGGIYVSAAFATSRLTLNKNTLSENAILTDMQDTTGFASGGGVYVSVTDAAAEITVNQNNITRNFIKAYRISGSGVYAFVTQSGMIQISQNTIFKNESEAVYAIGWGIYVSAMSHSSLSLTQNNIIKNGTKATSVSGNGMYTFASPNSAIYTRLNTVHSNSVLKVGDDSPDGIIRVKHSK